MRSLLGCTAAVASHWHRLHRHCRRRNCCDPYARSSSMSPFHRTQQRAQFQCVLCECGSHRFRSRPARAAPSRRWRWRQRHRRGRQRHGWCINGRRNSTAAGLRVRHTLVRCICCVQVSAAAVVLLAGTAVSEGMDLLWSLRASHVRDQYWFCFANLSPPPSCRSPHINTNEPRRRGQSMRRYMAPEICACRRRSVLRGRVPLSSSYRGGVVGR